MRQCVYDVGDSRTPHGVRGLKLNEFLFSLSLLVAPLTGCVD